MSYLPIIISAGRLEQLPSGQALDVGGWTLPTSGGSENYVLTANVSGDAVWAEAASDFGDPTADDQVLISTGVGTASWSTAGNDQLLASDGSGGVAWTNKPFGYDMDSPTTANTMLVSTGADTAAWDTKISSFQIGDVIFQNDNEIYCHDGVDPNTLLFMSDAQFSQDLFLTGRVFRSVPELASEGNGYLYNGHRYETFLDQTGTLKITIPLSWANMASTMKIIGYDRTTGGWELLVSGYADNVTDAWLGYGADLIGSAPFNQVRLAYDGANVCILLGTTSTSWNDPIIGIDKNLVATVELFDLFNTWGLDFLDSESGITDIVDVPFARDTFGNTIAEPTSAGQLYRATGAGAASWTTDITGLTSLTVDNITIDAATITSDTGSISFDNENLYTAGKAGLGSASVYENSHVEVVGAYTGDKYYSALHVRTANNTYGTFIGSPLSGRAIWSAGAHFATGSNWKARATEATGIYQNLGIIQFFTDTSLTEGEDYTPTSRGYFNSSGLTVTGTIVADNIPSPTAAGQLLQATAADAASWTTDITGLTSLTVDNITIDGSVITDSTGLVEIDDPVSINSSGASETWDLQVGNLDAVIRIGEGDAGGYSTVGSTSRDEEHNYHYQTYLAHNAYWDSIAEEWKSIRTNSGRRFKFAMGYQQNTFTWNYAAATGEIITWTELMNLDNSGNLSVTGTVVADNIPSPTADNQILQATAADAASWTTAPSGLTSLGVDNITIDGATITSDTGAISFDDENLSTTGTLTTGDHDILGRLDLQQLAGDNHSYKSIFQWEGPGGDSTGIMQIILPPDWCDCMMVIKITGYNYIPGVGGPWEVLVGGYARAASEAWIASSASIRGAHVPFDTVRLARDTATGHICILLGTTTSEWNYPQIDIDVSATFSGQTAVDGIWTCGFITSEAGLTSIATMDQSRDVECQTTDDKVMLSNADETFSWYTTCLSDVLQIETPSASGAERKFVLTATSGSKFAIESAPWPLTLTQDETIYVRTTGSDEIGDGSSGSPFLTLERTVEYLGGLYIGDYNVVVDIGEGVFAEAGTITMMHPFGSQIVFQGVSERITGQSIASISGTTSYGHDNLYYRSMTMVLPVGKSVSVGDYIACSAASGGTNPNAINGLHPVSVWVSGTRTATVEVAYKNGSETPSGAISCIIDLIKSVIAFSDKNGIKIIGPYYGGTWRGLVIQGDYDGANDAKNGIWALNGAVVSLATAPTSGYGAGVWGFQTGLYSQNNGLIFADYGFVSKAGQHLTACQNGGILSLRSSTLNACNNSGIFAYNGSTVSGNNITIVGTGNNSVFSYQGSFIDITSSFVGESDSTTSVIADRWSGIDGTGATVDDAISPVTDGNNDGSYVIGL